MGNYMVICHRNVNYKKLTLILVILKKLHII